MKKTKIENICRRSHTSLLCYNCNVLPFQVWLWNLWSVTGRQCVVLTAKLHHSLRFVNSWRRRSSQALFLFYLREETASMPLSVSQTDRKALLYHRTCGRISDGMPGWPVRSARRAGNTAWCWRGTASTTSCSTAHLWTKFAVVESVGKCSLHRKLSLTGHVGTHAFGGRVFRFSHCVLRVSFSARHGPHWLAQDKCKITALPASEALSLAVKALHMLDQLMLLVHAASAHLHSLQGGHSECSLRTLQAWARSMCAATR